MKIKFYQYEKCSTCRKAKKFLDSRGLAYESLPIVDTPPSRAELAWMLERVGGDMKRLFNTSGQRYRELGVSEKLKAMAPAQAVELLAREGKLVKRPFVIAGDKGLVGFDEKSWRAVFR